MATRKTVEVISASSQPKLVKAVIDVVIRIPLPRPTPRQVSVMGVVTQLPQARNKKGVSMAGRLTKNTVVCVLAMIKRPVSSRTRVNIISRRNMRVCVACEQCPRLFRQRMDGLMAVVASHIAADPTLIIISPVIAVAAWAM